MPRHKDSEPHPALPAAQAKPKNWREIRKHDASNLPMPELWKHLTYMQKKYILSFPKYDTKTECVREIGVTAGYNPPLRWAVHMRESNPYFKEAEKIRMDTPDAVVIDLMEMDMRVLLLNEACDMVRAGEVPKKDIISVNKRLANSVKGDEAQKEDETVNASNVVSFMNG